MQLVVLPHRKKINDDNPSKDGELTFFFARTNSRRQQQLPGNYVV